MDLRSRFSDFKTRSGVSFTAIGRATKLTASSIKAWVENTGGDLEVGESFEAVSLKIGSWLEIELAKERIQLRLSAIPECVTTPVLKKIHSGCGFVKALGGGKFFVGIGCAGSGKSTAARAFVEGRHDVHYLMIEPATGHLRECLSALAAELRCNVGDATTQAISRAIVERLKGTGGLLILDEAQHLNFAAVEQIRIIAEKAGIGVALLGNSSIFKQMGGGRRSEGFDQLRSRIAKRLEIPTMTLSDVQPIAESFGVRGDRELSLLAQIAKKDGALRDVTNILQTILIDDGEISCDRIVETWKDLSGEDLRPQRAERTPTPAMARIGRAG